MDKLDLFILDCANATLSSHNILVNSDSICRQAFKILEDIIFNNNYNSVTKSYGMRDRIMEYNPSLLRTRIDNKIRRSLDEDLTTDDRIFRSSLRKYCDYLSFIYDEYAKKREGLFQPKCYAPSNHCKEAVVSGKQFKVSYSSEKIAGMQAYSDVGKVRKNQEDSYYIGVHPDNPNFKIMLVADGMGGHAAGEYASNIASLEMLKWFESIPSSEYFSKNDFQLDEGVVKTLSLIDRRIKKEHPGSGTTLCFAIQKEDSIYMANIGDSRGFVLEDGKLNYQTMSDNIPSVNGIPESFGRFHPQSNVLLNSLGNLRGNHNFFEAIHKNSIPMKRGKNYSVVLCSDGVSDCLSDDEIMYVINHSDSDSVASNLVHSALNHRSSFKEELENYKIQAGIMGKFAYKKMLKVLKSFGMNEDYDKIIPGGKDNTTAIYGEFGRGSR